MVQQKDKCLGDPHLLRYHLTKSPHQTNDFDNLLPISFFLLECWSRVKFASALLEKQVSAQRHVQLSFRYLSGVAISMK